MNINFFYISAEILALNLFNFQDPATPIMEGITMIYDHVMYYLILVLIFVFWWISSILYKFTNNYTNSQFIKLFLFYSKNSKTVPANSELTLWSKSNNFYQTKLYAWPLHNTSLEIIWTLVPTIILYLIAVPSFLLLYSLDEIINPLVTLKVIGNQWYWSYEYSDYVSNSRDSISFDSYLIPEYELKNGQLRLLEVDNPVVLPVKVHIRALVTSTDVLHAWAVPALGVKIDAVPGRLNQVSIFLKSVGDFFGQCSEICGVDHGFMPIHIKSVILEDYLNFLNKNLD